MKIRSCFISNSSTSSFVLAFKKTQKCEHCGQTPFDFLTNLSIDPKTNYNKITDVECEIKSTMNDIIEFNKDKEFLEKEIEKYRKIIADPDEKSKYEIAMAEIQELITNFERIRSLTRNTISKNNYKSNIERLPGILDHYQSDYIGNEISSMEIELKIINGKINSLNAYCDNLKKYSTEDWAVFSISEIDHMDTLDSKINDLINAGIFMVVKKETT